MTHISTSFVFTPSSSFSYLRHSNRVNKYVVREWFFAKWKKKKKVCPLYRNWFDTSSITATNPEAHFFPTQCHAMPCIAQKKKLMKKKKKQPQKLNFCPPCIRKKQPKNTLHIYQFCLCHHFSFFFLSFLEDMGCSNGFLIIVDWGEREFVCMCVRVCVCDRNPRWIHSLASSLLVKSSNQNHGATDEKNKRVIRR